MRQAPSGPELSAVDVIETKLGQLFELSRQILGLGAEPDLPVLGQMVIRRSVILGELTVASETPGLILPEPLMERFKECQALDKSVEAYLNTYLGALEEELKQLRGTRNLMDKYRASQRDTGGSHAQDA